MGRKARPPELLNDNERKYLLEIIKTRIKYIVYNAEILLQNKGDLEVITALYIHAVEEYGKYLYVANLSSSSGIVEVEMENKFLDHNYKISLALNQLPKECSILHKGGFGKNYGGNFDIDTLADFETRLTIFNTDIENGKAKHLPSVDSEKLETAITEFRKRFGI